MVILSDSTPVPTNLGFDFSHFELVSGSDKTVFCRDNNICALFDNDPDILTMVSAISPDTARLQVLP